MLRLCLVLAIVAGAAALVAQTVPPNTLSAREKAERWRLLYPGYGKARRGKIGLQDHGNRIWFRNVKVRTVP